MSIVFRGLRPAEQPYADWLRERAVEPGEVERVVMTHLHVDHTSGMRLLPRARFLCTQAEWRAATSRGAANNGYVAHHLPGAERMDLVDFDAEGEPFGPFSATLDLLGDGSIRLLSTPGHTKGHLSILVRTSDHGEVLIVGDAAYTLRSIRDEILPLLTTGDDRYRASLRELKAWWDANPDSTLIPTHDPDAWRALAEEAAPAAGASA